MLEHLRYHLTDVPPQPNSPPDYVFVPWRVVIWICFWLLEAQQYPPLKPIMTCWKVNPALQDVTFSPNIPLPPGPKETKKPTYPTTYIVYQPSTQLNSTLQRAGLQNDCTLGCFIATLPGHERWFYRRPQGLTKIQGKSIGGWPPWKMMGLEEVISRWWFQLFFIFTPTWGNDPIWLIFFKWVETTN